MLRRVAAESSSISSAESAVALREPAGETVAWRFNGFEFDLLRGELRGCDGGVIALRPKTETLLRLFLAQAGRLLSRDELIEAVWPGAVVTDDSLVQCVGDLRTALGDADQRVIRTVPRRGYRFDVAVAGVTDAAPPAGASVDPIAEAQAASSPGAPAAPAARTVQTSPRRWRLAGGFVVALVTLTAGWAAMRAPPPSVPIGIDETVRSRATVAVMSFVVDAGAGDGESTLRGTADAVADGITGEISTRIGMRGIGRAATKGFDAAAPPLDLIAGALKATHVLTGRIARANGEQAAIDVQIVAIASGEVIWAKHFETPRSDAAAFAEIGRHVTVAMRRRGPVEAQLRAARPSHTADGADLALLGWGDLDGAKSLVDMRRARMRFEAASRDDPQSVIALTGLSAAYFGERINPQSALTREQIAEHERVTNLAIRLAPDNDTAMNLWGSLQILRGRPDLALPALEKSMRLVPSQPLVYTRVAEARLLLGRADEVRALTDRTVALGAGDARRVSAAYLVAAEAALMLGDDERANDQARRAIAELPSNARAYATLAALDALAGRQARAAAELAIARELWPTVTIETYDELRRSTHPVFLAQRARLYEGLRLAGLRER